MGNTGGQLCQGSRHLGAAEHAQGLLLLRGTRVDAAVAHKEFVNENRHKLVQEIALTRLVDNRGRIIYIGQSGRLHGHHVRVTAKGTGEEGMHPHKGTRPAAEHLIAAPRAVLRQGLHTGGGFASVGHQRPLLHEVDAAVFHTLGHHKLAGAEFYLAAGVVKVHALEAFEGFLAAGNGCCHGSAAVLSSYTTQGPLASIFPAPLRRGAEVWYRRGAQCCAEDYSAGSSWMS